MPLLIDLGDHRGFARLEAGAGVLDEVSVDALPGQIKRGADKRAGAEADGRPHGPTEQTDEAAREHAAKRPDGFRVGRSPHRDVSAGVLHDHGVVVQRECAVSMHAVQGAIALVCLLLRVEPDEDHLVHDALSFR